MPSAPARSDADLTDAERYARARRRRAASLYARQRAGLVPSFRQAARERTLELIRGALIERADRAFLAGEVGELLWQGSDNPALQAKGVELFQALMAALFPEEFREDAEIARTLAEVRAGKACGVVPSAGTGLLNKAGRGDLRRFAERLATG